MEKQLSKEQVSVISYFLIRSCFMGLAMEMLVQIAKQDSIFGSIPWSITWNHSFFTLPISHEL